ncbi:unnamed protein product [Moneuplotes crassus]|uniref:Uncharacterized protein n=1 Tax=Euplotes crassus TaxID=5936 RepID=A0AAD1XK93_EUPCR|nr:unnamed protein product [Moneuplotes crassus]
MASFSQFNSDFDYFLFETYLLAMKEFIGTKENDCKEFMACEVFRLGFEVL